MTKTTGDYFKDKAEAVEFYKNNTDSLKDKPDWLIEAVIDFACQYPNYKEYLEVESKVANGEELTAKQKKKYGHLSWEQQTTKYKKDQVLYGIIEINQKGEYWVNAPDKYLNWYLRPLRVKLDTGTTPIRKILGASVLGPQ